jgi:hypothetical protein
VQSEQEYNLKAQKPSATGTRTSTHSSWQWQVLGRPSGSYITHTKPVLQVGYSHYRNGRRKAVSLLHPGLLRLSWLLGRMYDSVVLSGDALRSLNDAWCEYARLSLLHVVAVVSPLRVETTVQLLQLLVC